MKKVKLILFILLFLQGSIVFAQDKLYFKNGTSLFCKILQINESTINYKDTATIPTITSIQKDQVMLLEYQTGEIYIFGVEPKPLSTINNYNETKQQQKERKMSDWKKEEDTLSNNILGFYLPVILLGRFGISFERLFANKSMGIKIPLILTYNPASIVGGLSSGKSKGSNSSSNPPKQRNDGVGFMTGIDLNFYHDIKAKLKYYFGPRIRYGTDILLGTEGLSVQIQNGIFKSGGKRMTQTFGVGFGFFKSYKKKLGGPTGSDVSPSISVTWRLGFRL